MFGLAFIDPKEHEAQLERLRTFPFNPEDCGPFYDRIVAFQADFCEYMLSTWIRYLTFNFKLPNLKYNLPLQWI